MSMPTQLDAGEPLRTSAVGLRIPATRLRTGARGDVDDCPTVAAILGAEGGVVDLELPDAGERRVEEEKVNQLIVDSNAVDLEVDCFLSIACGIEAQRATTTSRRRKEAVLRRR